MALSLQEPWRQETRVERAVCKSQCLADGKVITHISMYACTLPGLCHSTLPREKDTHSSQRRLGLGDTDWEANERNVVIILFFCIIGQKDTSHMFCWICRNQYYQNSPNHGCDAAAREKKLRKLISITLTTWVGFEIACDNAKLSVIGELDFVGTEVPTKP